MKEVYLEKLQQKCQTMKARKCPACTGIMEVKCVLWPYWECKCGHKEEPRLFKLWAERLFKD